jgi:hypothetical protein
LHTIQSFQKRLFTLVLIFFISRSIFFSLGIHFDVIGLKNYIQILDPFDLQHDLTKSIFYLHIQPPLFNLFIGIILKLFPHQFILAFQTIYLTMGLIFFIALFILMKKLGTREDIGFILTVLFMINPSTILYENWLFYTYPVAILLVLSSLSLVHLTEKNQKKGEHVFFILISSLVLLRNSFQFFWFLFWVGIVAWIQKHYKRIVLAAFIPFIVIFVICLKNWILFKSFSTTSKTASIYQIIFNLVIPNTSYEEMDKAAKAKPVPFTLLPEFCFLEDIGEWAFKNVPMKKTGISVLDNYYKRSGHKNFNSIYHIYTADSAKEDMYYMMKHYPKESLRASCDGYMIYFFPGPTDMFFSNRKYLSDYENTYHFMFHHLNTINNNELYDKNLFSSMGFREIKWDALSRILYSFQVIIFLALIIFGLRFTYHQYKKDPSGKFLPLFFIISNILYITIIGNTFSSIGNNRYRYEINAFYLILFGLWLTEALKRRGEKVKHQQV